MRCKRILKYLPLFVGAELSPKKDKAIRTHLDTCVGCRKEHQAYIQALKIAKDLLSKSTVAWSEDEWERIVFDAAAEKSKSLSGFAPWPFKKGWAVAVMVAVMAIVIFFVTRPLYLGDEDFPSQSILSKHHPQNETGAVFKSPQDVVSITMVSKDTGLKVVWILNKNFNLEENK